jgi:diketogulonate reductase-like aldo/keto reductase
VRVAPAHPLMQRTIPRSGQSLPVIGLGTWQSFNPKRITDFALRRLALVVGAFYEAGGRLIDSSPMYGNAEQVIGTISQGLDLNADLFIATKVWMQGQAAGVAQMESSLQKLHREKIELMQVHNCDDFDTHIKTLRLWKDNGRFRYIGATHFSVNGFDQLEKIIRSGQIDFVQLPYSVGVRAAENRLLPAAVDHGVAVLINRPFEEGGLLKRVKARPLPHFIRQFAPTWEEALLKFIIATPAVTCVIPATSNVAHLHNNLRAGTGPLPTEPERRQLIDSLT